MAPFRLEGRTAVITGAASGIGAALASALAMRGCNLALADIDEAALCAVAARHARNGLRVTQMTVDVAILHDINAFAKAIERDHAGADLLFNNAGVALAGLFEEIAIEDFEWLVTVNFLGVVRMTRALLPLLRRAEESRIVNVSSLFGIIAPAGQTAYAASKFAVRGFSDALRHELRGSSIGVTTVHPGGVKTDIARRAIERQKLPAAQRDNALKRSERLLRMAPEQAAETILRAVEKRKSRVLVGADAKLAAFVERLAPASYWSLLGGRN